jgi:hypothetical protein
MALRQKSVIPAICLLSGAKSGKKIGRMLSTAAKNVVASEANYLYTL